MVTDKEMNQLLMDTLEVMMPIYALTSIETLSNKTMIFLYPLPVVLYLVGALILLCMWEVSKFEDNKRTNHD
jgi:hypothetical protein